MKDYAPLTEEERKYARNPLTHVDFLLFNQMDKQPVLAIEVDGGSHKSGSKQAERDAKKNSILEKCAVPLLRLRTDGSGEKRKSKCTKEGLIMPRIIRNAIRCKNVEKSSRAKPSMILSFAAAAPALWTAATITFAGAEIVRIGKSCPKWKAGEQRCIDLILMIEIEG